MLLGLSAALAIAVRPAPALSVLMPLLALTAFTCTVQLFVVEVRWFLLLLLLQIIAALALAVAPGPQRHLIEIMMVSLVVLNVVLRLPLRFSLPICITVMIIPAVASFGQGEPLVGSVSTLGVEIAVLVISLRVVHYREAVVDARGQLLRERESVNNLTAANDSLLRHLPEMKEESAEQERLRITRELHDALGYSMTNIVMIMNAAQYLIGTDAEKVREYCRRTKDLASSTMDEIRETLYKLREIGRLTPDNPAIFFHHLCRDFEEATGVTTECHTGNLVRQLPKRIFDLMLRTVQVGFINALKHGKATRIGLQIWIGETELTMTIWNSLEELADDGMTVSREGIGLSGVRERLAEVEGTLEASYIMNGFHLIVHIPRRELTSGLN